MKVAFVVRLSFLTLTMLAVLTASAQDKTYRVAFFAASSENGFNQAIYQGIVDKAAELGNIETEIFNGDFNADIQYNQLEDVATAGNFDAFIIAPNDTVGIATAVADVTAKGIPVATTLFPIGPDLTSLEPQVEGLTATVANPPAAGATAQAEDVVAFCADKDPCNVVIAIGQKIFPFDNLRLETFNKVLAEHSNIKVVSTIEGNYDPNQSLTAMQDVLQANPDIDVVLSNADQHLVGIEIALQDAGIEVEPIYMSGGGASQIAIDAIREGRWDVTLAYFPNSMGRLALEAVIAELNGEPHEVAIDMDKFGPVPTLINKEVLDANPEFEGEWEG
jgi:ribose transport system substrate-binding protein